MAWFFTEEEVGRLLPMTEAVARVEEAFRLLGEGKAVNRPRSRVRTEGIMLHVMPAGSAALGYVGLKAYTTGRWGARFFFLLFDAEEGALLAILEADRLGQIRTGAATAVATRHLAPPGASRVGIYGTGWQARSQIEALSVSRRLSRVLAYSPNEARRRTFCEEMSARLEIPLEPASSPEEVARESEILVTATSAREPVLLGAWLRPGQHLNAVGSNALSRREIDEEAVTRSTWIVTDSLEQAKLECGDLAAVVESGKLSWDRVQELGRMVAGREKRAREGTDLTLFASQGIAIEDVAVAKTVYETGRAQGAGTELPF